jgi:hypothetical protein
VQVCLQKRRCKKYQDEQSESGLFNLATPILDERAKRGQSSRPDKQNPQPLAEDFVFKRFRKFKMFMVDDAASVGLMTN